LRIDVTGIDEGFCGILLAAGRSTRFGSDKLMHPLPDGTALALASGKAMMAAMPRVVAVVSGENPVLTDLFEREGLGIVIARQSDEGMGRSLAAGIAATAESAGWIVGLADMPFIRPETISLVLAALKKGAPLVAPVFQGKRGHPVGFDCRFRQALLALRGDEGARQLLQDHREKLTLLECTDTGVVRDIDRTSDLFEVASATNPYNLP
jgi:molybdenum cofactor cytidylyltransferase